MSSTLRKIIDEELEFAEKSVLNGGYLPATISARIAGVSRKYIYKLGEKGRVEMLIVDGWKFFPFLTASEYVEKGDNWGTIRKSKCQAKFHRLQRPDNNHGTITHNGPRTSW